MPVVAALADRSEAGLVIAVGARIDGTADLRGEHVGAVGAYAFKRAAGIPAILLRRGEERSAEGVVRAPIEGGARPGAARLYGQQLDDAAQRARAVKVAGRAAHHFDAIDRRQRDAVPVDPAAERIV